MQACPECSHPVRLARFEREIPKGAPLAEVQTNCARCKSTIRVKLQRVLCDLCNGDRTIESFQDIGDPNGLTRRTTFERKRIQEVCARCDGEGDNVSANVTLIQRAPKETPQVTQSSRRRKRFLAALAPLRMQQQVLADSIAAMRRK